MEDKINKFSPSRNNLKKQIKVSNKSDRSSCNDINTTNSNNNFTERKINPFWVARDNSEIFTKKKLMGLEKKKINLMTENSEIINSQENNVFLTDQGSPTSVFLKNSSKNLNFNSQQFSNLTFNKLGSVRNYINKTKDIIYLKHSIKMKEERLIRIGESQKNELETVRESIISMVSAKKLERCEFRIQFTKIMPRKDELKIKIILNFYKFTLKRRKLIIFQLTLDFVNKH